MRTGARLTETGGGGFGAWPHLIPNLDGTTPYALAQAGGVEPGVPGDGSRAACAARPGGPGGLQAKRAPPRQAWVSRPRTTPSAICASFAVLVTARIVTAMAEATLACPASSMCTTATEAGLVSGP